MDWIIILKGIEKELQQEKGLGDYGKREWMGLNKRLGEIQQSYVSKDWESFARQWDL